MPTPFFPSAAPGRAQEIPKLLSGQEKLAADVAVVEWIIDTARPLTVSEHPKFRKMMQASSAGRYHGPCYETVHGLTMHLSQNGKDAASNFLHRLMTDGTKAVVGADFWSSSGHALLGVTGQQLIDSDGFNSIWRHLHVQLSRAEQVSVSLLPRVELTLKLCTTSDCCRVLCRIVSPAQTVPSGGKSPQTSEADKTRLEMQDWLQMPAIQTSAVIGKNTDGSDITQDVDVLVWWRDVGQARFPRIAVMARQFLAIPAASATAERVFSFAGLTLSDLRKSLVEGTLEAIMWAKWGSPSIPLGRGDLHITHPELCD